VIVVLVINSCSSTQNTNNACNEMTTTDCMNSSKCTMELNPIENNEAIYICRDSINVCESNFSQSSDMKEKCESRKGCVYNFGCYCPCKGYGETIVKDNAKESCLCDCGFGEPAGCQERPNTALHSDSLPLAGEL